MAEIDGPLLATEVAVAALLAAQLALAVGGGAAAYLFGRYGGRAWGLAVLASLAVVAAGLCGFTLAESSNGREAARARLQGRAPGPHLSGEKAANHLAGLTRASAASVGIAAATAAGSWGLWRFGRRRRIARAGPGGSTAGGA